MRLASLHVNWPHDRVPNLEEMDEQQAHRFLTDLLSNLSAEAEYHVRHEDYVMEMPQSGERIRGREKMREPSPTTPTRRQLSHDGWSLGSTCG